MLALLQRVTNASVKIENETYASIKKGLLIFCGFETNDNHENIKKLIDKCFNYRMFSDDNNKMNLSLRDVKGQALLVPQFTLVADTSSGLRPSFSKGMPPSQGKILFDELKLITKELYINTTFGKFGADMKVDLSNDGPVTFIIN